MRVLMVDDDAQVRRVVRRTLERADFAVTEAGDPESALRAMADWPIDVAVLDLNLPVMSGLELMTRLRQHDPDLPVIMLTGAGSEADRVRGLVSGADDYVVKPFSAQELAARVLAASRRRRTASVPVVESGGIRINVTAREVSAGGEVVDLTRREFDLLLHLVENPGRVFSRAELLHAVWASSAEWQSEATVTEHVRRLRSKLELDPAHPVRIVTVRGLGYRFDPHLPASIDTTSRPAPVIGPAAPAADLADDPTAVIQREIIVYVNAAALELVGASDEDHVVGRPFVDFIAPQSVGASMARHLDARAGHWPRPEMLTVRRLDGVEVNVEIASMPAVWADEAASQVTLWNLNADTVRLRELATGFTSEVTEAVVVADADSAIRSFNNAAEALYGWTEADVLGRPVGEILRLVNDEEIGAPIRAVFHAEGRWHGDATLARRDGSEVNVRTSITMLRGGDGQPVGTVFVSRLADDRSTPVAGGGGRPSYQDQRLADEIHRGIQRSEFTLRYQPVIDLQTGTWHGVEALVRWEHPERGLLAPAEFIDVAERSGFIVELGQAVFNEAARQWRKWRNVGLDLHIAVNLSGRQLADPELTTRIASAMKIWSLPPGSLRFEVTETALVEDLSQATAALGQLVELGAEIAIDDFGTGWASLTYLREFPVHALKIDRVFVSGLGVHAPDTAIVTSILSLGAELGLDVIAEGIETQGQLDRLLALGCELGQGYLFARPMTADDVQGQHR